MRRAFCLNVRAFTNPPIGQALAGRALDGFVGALGVVHAERGAGVVAEIKLRKVAMQVRLCTAARTPSLKSSLANT
jgi:hypothetical protein